MMKETACQFGEGGSLAGIVIEPSPAHRTVACVIVTAGLAPKFGPFRLYSALARRLGQAGFITLRFDLGGVGDSAPGRVGATLVQRTDEEIRAALDYVAKTYKIDRIMLCGSCSGAENAFRYAALDERVVGVAMIDPFGYRTPGWAWRHAVHRLVRRSLRALRLYQPLNFDPVSAPVRGDKHARLVQYHYLERPQSEAILRKLLQRGTRLHFIYTGAMLDTFNHRGQLKKMFPDVDFGNRVTVDHFPKSEHSPVLGVYRQMLVESIGRVATTAFPRR
jgi:pimeloyl-ACP methyl ester carboxylesterase